MKKHYLATLAVLLAGTISHGALADNYNTVTGNPPSLHQTVMNKDVSYQPQAKAFEKGVYSGSSAYTGNLTGRIAVEDYRDGDNNAFIVSPVRGGEFNSSLRYGDTSQSAETRINHTFNN